MRYRVLRREAESIARRAEGKTVNELAEEAIRKGLEERSWQDLLEYGRQAGLASGYVEAHLPDIIKNRCRINA